MKKRKVLKKITNTGAIKPFEKWSEELNTTYYEEAQQTLPDENLKSELFGILHERKDNKITASYLYVEQEKLDERLPVTPSNTDKEINRKHRRKYAALKTDKPVSLKKMESLLDKYNYKLLYNVAI